MSAQDRYTKIIESLVNGDEANASDLLHEAIVDKAARFGLILWSKMISRKMKFQKKN